ncbi:MAG: right-handed parallel beta-helix repeat-containing protein, partial [bacterium]
MKFLTKRGSNPLSFIITFFLFILFTLTSCNKEGGNDLYVALNGDDANIGTIDSPLRTIEGARDKIRKLVAEKGYPKEKITVYFREGNYEIERTIEFNERDSGRVDAPIKYTRYKDEKVSFSGGKKIDGSLFTLVTDSTILNRIIDDQAREKLVSVNLKSLGITQYGEIKQHGFSVAILPAQMELFVNGEPKTLARWPNEGKIDIMGVVSEGSIPYKGDFSGVGPVIIYGDDRHREWQEPGNIWLWGFFKEGYADDNLGVEKIDTIAKTIKLKHPHMFGVTKTDRNHEWHGRNAGYYAYNVLEEIDMPGEYYIDRDNGILYYYPGENLAESDISVSMMEDPLFALENVSNMIIEGITIENGRGIGVYIERGNNNQIRGCTLRNFGTIAVMFGKGVTGADYPIHEFTGQLKSRTVGNLKAHHYNNTEFYNEAGTNHGIIGCNIYHTGSGGIVLSGGKRATLEEGNNYVENCDIHHTNRRNKTYCAQITLYGVGNRISHCNFHDAPHLAIAIFGNEHTIEYSRFERLVLDIHDAGAIGIGRNPSARGNKILYNYFADLGSEGFKNTALHLDDGSSALTVKGNIFYKASKMDFGDVTLNGGSDNLITNNIFIEGAYGIWLENPVLAKNPYYMIQNGLNKGGVYWQRMKEDLDISSDAWKDKYPEFANMFEWETPFLLRNKVVNNVFYKTPLLISSQGFDTTSFEVWENNWKTDEDPGFVNLEKKNFNLKEGAPLFEKVPGFEPIPLDKMGIFKDKYRDML